MKKIIIFISTLILFGFMMPSSFAYTNETPTGNALLKKYIKEFKSPTSNKVSLVSYIASLKTKKAANFLLTLVDTNNSSLKEEIIYQLGVLKEKRAASKIIKYLKHDSTRVRNEVVNALAQIKDKGSVKPLIEYIRNCGEGNYYAAKALLSMNVKEAIPIILSNITTPGSGISADLAKAIPQDGCTQDFKVKARELLKDKDSDVRIMAISMLGAINDKDSIMDIVLLLKDPDDRVRVKAAYVLGDFKEKSTMQDLINSLNDRCINVRTEALYSLGLFNQESIVPHIEKILFSNEDPSVKIAAAYSLGQINSTKSVDVLVKALNFQDSEVQMEAIKSLSYFNDSYKAKNALRGLLYNKDKTISNKAKEALKLK